MKLKIVSVNLWHGGQLLDGIIEFLKTQDADVVVMQEAFNATDPSVDRQYHSMEILSKELGYEHSDFVADFRDFDRTDGKAQRGNGILSKYPIIGRDAVFFVRPYTEEYRDVPGQFEDCPRDLQHVVLDTPVGEVNVFNIQGVWDLNGDNYSDRRRYMAEVVIEAVKDKHNVIVAGDTNAKQANQAILDIEQHLDSVFKRDLVTTFNMRRKDNPGYATAAVDGVFISNDMRVIEKECHDVDISDHLPLSVTVELQDV